MKYKRHARKKIFTFESPVKSLDHTYNQYDNMCGRYILVQKTEVIEKAFNIIIPPSTEYSPDFNIAPGKPGLVITSEKPREAQSFRFGLTPFWAQKPMYLINARAEGDQNPDNLSNYSGAKGIINKPAFRMPIRSQRCLVLADAFIEGTTAEKLNKPFLIYLKERKPFAFAGIWDRWTDRQSGEIIHSFAIITTVANDLLARLPHHRSPVILEKGMEEKWLHAEHLNDITWMMKPYPAELMNGFPIKNGIKNPHAAGRELIEPAGERLVAEEEVKGSTFLELHGMGRYKIR
jgi:putative SOS response-associated peptidase YedK